jgi:hypothetical protein
MVGTTARAYGDPKVACLTSPKSYKTTSVETEVQHITSGVSDNFVPTPTSSKVLEDLLIGLKRFRNSVCWKWFFLELAKNKRQYFTLHTPQSNSDPLQEPKDEVIINQGLATGVKPKQRFAQSPQASIEVESFLKDVECALLKNRQTSDLKGSKEYLNGEIKSLKLSLMNDTHLVVVPTDKTNSYKIILRPMYISWVDNILQSDARVISKLDLSDIHKTCEDKLNLLDKVLSKGKFSFIKETIKSKKIPTPTLLIKNHKDKDSFCDYPC